jgi:positive regulator of sigma E activity
MLKYTSRKFLLTLFSLVILGVGFLLDKITFNEFIVALPIVLAIYGGVNVASKAVDYDHQLINRPKKVSHAKEDQAEA